MGATRNFLLAAAMMTALPSVAAAQQATAPATAAAATAATAASSGGGIQIPEPGDLALFLIGVAGLIVGRWSARSRKRNQE